MADRPPRVFISYSHDSDEHKTWVRQLATQLRYKGVDAVLDQWDLKPGKDVPLFMEEQLSQCDHAILVCTKRYVEKANEGTGGVGYERMIVSAEMVKDIDAGKFIPIIREAGDNNVPRFIESKLYLDFTNDEYFESVFDDLLRTLLGAEISSKPPLGQPPEFDNQAGDAGRTIARSNTDLSIEAFEVFEFMIKRYDEGSAENWTADELISGTNFGRVTVDAALEELRVNGYAFVDVDDDYFDLTAAGKIFAKQIGLV